MTGKNVRLFIAEDSEHVLNALKAMVLEIEGAELIGHASDAATAAEQIESTNPDVAILDMRLASGSALDVLRSIHRPRKSAGVPVTIVFTSHVETRLRETCLKLGADYVLSKAEDAEMLANVLRSLVTLRSPTPDDGAGDAP